jgi:hypothetical protein
MEIHQILIRPNEKAVIVLYIDAVGNRSSLVLEANAVPGVGDFVAACRAKLPSDQDNPFKDKIQKEIATLEQRLTELRKAVGTA